MTIQEGAGLPEMRDFFEQFVGGGPWELRRGAAQALVVAAKQGRAVTEIAEGPSTAGAVDLAAPIAADVDADLLVNEVDFAREPQVIFSTREN